MTSKEIKIIENLYGEYWYKIFFNSYHITSTFDSIKNSSSKRKDIIDKFGSEWYNKHIDQIIYFKRNFYNYASSIYDKPKFKKDKLLDNDINYYLTKSESAILGGDLNDDDTIDEDSIDEDTIDEDTVDDIEESTDDDIELEKLYDIHESKDMNNMIDKMIDDENIVINKYNIIQKWDTSKDNTVYDEELKNVYSKIYIYNQYIYYDDNIFTLKKKICAGIKRNSILPEYDLSAFILPSRIYLWSEYEYEDNKLGNNMIKKDKIMIGHKWYKRNELLKVDIEPNSNIKVYEMLKDNLGILNDSINRFSSRIRVENEETLLLLDHIDYIRNNEIYMLDVYNELGANYKSDEIRLKNLYTVFIKIYFPNITQEEYKNIIDYLLKNNNEEANKIKNTYEIIKNELLLENEIVNTIESTRLLKNKYNYILGNNYITQAVIHLNLKYKTYSTSELATLDLFRLFDNYILNNTYPFLQYQTIDNKIIFKFYSKSEETDKTAIVSKWFENAPYGISFKIAQDMNMIKGDSTNKYISVSLSEYGKIEYKITWKETDEATLDDIKNSYNYIKVLIEKLNKENSNKLEILEPDDNDFKFAFINTIQQFKLSDTSEKHYNINHNDLSDFARYFYPYIAVVIEPRKRQAKIKKTEDEKSKYGTYLRYKKISKYENESKIEQRIIYFLKNYEYDEKKLIVEIAKQFNITEKIAFEKILSVKNKFQNIRKSRNVLKKFTNLPKYKPPGIGIDIQGRKREQYKIRRSGARSNYQLMNIISFMNILLYLYIEIYLRHNKQYIGIKNKLKELVNIAKRRNKVEEIVQEDIEVSTVKTITKLDKDRIGFRPDKGQNQWTRSCQNSGTVKRRPLVFTDTNDLVKQGFTYNDKTSYYEKESIKGIIRAIDLPNSKGDKIYYVCTPQENKEYTYVGFLSKSANPYGICMPCCFKKDQLKTTNKKKKEYFLKCTGKGTSTTISVSQSSIDKFYILQENNKMQEGRFGYLPKYLDIFMNTYMNNKKIIKNHYFVSSSTGYFFKYGCSQDESPYLNAIASCLNITLHELKKVLIDYMQHGMDQDYFIFINNGDIKTQFGKVDNYIQYIKNNKSIDYLLIDDLICYPNVLYKDGLNTIIFEKINDEYSIICKNSENLENYYDISKRTIILLKEDDFYYPIVMAYKIESAKSIQIDKFYNYEKKDTNIIHHIMPYIILSCADEENTLISSSMIAKQLYRMLLNMKTEYHPSSQIIDQRNKCKYLVISDNILLPVTLSGSIYKLPIYNDLKSFIKKNNYADIEDYIRIYSKLNKLVILFNINSIIVDDKDNIIGLIINNLFSVPVKPIKYKKKYNYTVVKQSLNDIVDEALLNLNDNDLDDRIKEVNQNKFLDELYELFRYELSYYLNTDKGDLKVAIIDILEEDNDKYAKLNKLLNNSNLYNFIIIDNKIFEKQLEEVINNINYKITNIRSLCRFNKNNTCITHCLWKGGCKFLLNDKLFNEYIIKIINELIINELKRNELLQLDNYYISDIVDPSRYTNRDNQKIIKDNELNVNRILSNIFGKDNIPIIGKYRYGTKKLITEEKKPIKTKYYIAQEVYNQQGTGIIRAYSNGYYWLKRKSLNSYNNLGYICELQTNLTNYFKSLIIDFFLYNKAEVEQLVKLLNKIIDDNDILQYISNDSNYIRYLGIIDLYILNYYHKIPIILYDTYDNPIIIIDKSIIYASLTNFTYGSLGKLDKYKYINIKFNEANISSSSLINEIYVKYYYK